MRKRDLLRLNNAIVAIENRKFTATFSLFLATNKIKVKEVVEILQKLKEPSEEYKNYDGERVKLAKDHADKNADGTAKIDNQNFIIKDQVDAFKIALDKLREKYRDIIKDQEQQSKDFEEILDEEVKYDGRKIKVEDIPDDIEPAVIEVLLIANLIDNQEQPILRSIK